MEKYKKDGTPDMRWKGNREAEKPTEQTVDHAALRMEIRRNIFNLQKRKKALMKHDRLYKGK